MKKNWLIYLGLVFVSSTISTGAFAQARVALVGGVDYNLFSEERTIGGAGVKAKGGLGLAGGAMLQVSMLEIGALYTTRKYTTETTTGTRSISADSSDKFINVPVMLRLGMAPVTFGVGGFYEFYTEDGGGTNYGITGGPRFGHELFFDLRFNYGLKGNSKTKDLVALVGFSFGHGK